MTPKSPGTPSPGSTPFTAPDAPAPFLLPRRNWWRVLKRVWTRNDEAGLDVLAAGCAFYALFSVFPGLTALVSLFGLYADPVGVERELRNYADVLPPDAYTLIAARLTEVAGEGRTTLQFSLVISVGLALFSATRFVKALINALNVIYREREKRNLFSLNLVAIGFTAVAILGMAIVIGGVILLPAVFAVTGWDAEAAVVLGFARWPLLCLFLFCGLLALYRLGPCRRHARLAWLWPGAFLATLLWLVSSVGFSTYVANAEDYGGTYYGAFGGLMILLFWFWLGCSVVLIGALLDAELEHETAADTTIGPPKPMGQRRAFMADRTA